MHAKPDLRVFLKWMIARSGSVITDVISLKNLHTKRNAMTKISQKDMFHGAVLAQITSHESFTALNSVGDGKQGHYLINNNIRLLTKLTKDKSAPWNFNFSATDTETIREDIEQGFETFAALVCADATICLLNVEQMNQSIDLDLKKQQGVRVDIPGASMRVRGKLGEIKGKIKHIAFPNKLFE